MSRRLNHSGPSVAAIAMTLVLAAGGPAARATTYTVLNLGETGADSLRAAVDAANAAGGTQTIVFQDGLSGTISYTAASDYTFGPAALVVTCNLTITGPSGGVTIARGSGSLRFFNVTGSLTVDSLTFGSGSAQGGAGGSGGDGGGGGGAGMGGAIYTTGTLTVRNCLFRNNSATGGAGGSGAYGQGPGSGGGGMYGNGGTCASYSGGGGGGTGGYGGNAGSDGSSHGAGGGGGGANGGENGGNGTLYVGGAGGGTTGGQGGDNGADGSNARGSGGGGGGAGNGGQPGNGSVGGGGGGASRSSVHGGSGGWGAGGGGGAAYVTAGGSGGFGGGGGGGEPGYRGTSTFGGGNGGYYGGGGAAMGGAIFNESGTLSVSNSTFTANGAYGGSGGNAGQGLGGAIFSYYGTVTLLNITLSANTAADGGRDFYAYYGTAHRIDNCILGQSDTAVTDLSGNTATFTGVKNIVRTYSGSGCTFNLTGTLAGDPLLGALASNGGPTQSMLQQSASPAVDAGDDTAAGGLTYDQRGPGFPRIAGPHVDIGALELVGPPTVTTTSATLSGTTGFDAGGNVTDDGGASVTVRGICWNTAGTPTTADGKTTNGGGAGSFTSNATVLSENTHYYFRAYATNGIATSYGEQKTIITGSSTPVAGYAWTEQTTASVRNWVASASSADATKLVTAVYGGYIYTSADSGASWTERTVAGSRNWYGLASSYDGTKLVAVAMSGYIYTSTDSGVSWTERTSAGSRGWMRAASSSDGTELAAAVNGGYIYTSSDSGANWTERTAAGSRAWNGLCSSSDGTKLATVVQPGYIYTSTDSGATWTEQTGAGSRAWLNIESSSDGTKLATGYWAGYIYTSSDSGVTWTQRTAAGINHWEGLACSADGTKLAARPMSGYLRTSADSGVTWTSQTGAGSREWFGLAFSSDATKLAAVVYGGYIYTAGPPIAPTVTTTSATLNGTTGFDAGGNVTSDGGATVSARGICWNTTGTATATGSHTTDGTGTDVFTSHATALDENTHYYFRAYATNAIGTSYGEQRTIITGSSTVVAGYAWTERTDAGSRSWIGIASSGDGAKLAAVVNGGYVYTSTDSGATWTERTVAGSRAWRRIASSYDGTKLAAVVNAGYVYTSADSGATWTERTAAGSRNWICIASSSDGVKLAAGTCTGYIYTSTDSGATWTEQTASGSRCWYAVACSSDGTKLLAGVDGGFFYTSTDSGATWTANSDYGVGNWYAAAMSSDGTKLAIATRDGYIHTSTNSGVNWTVRDGAGARAWYALATCADGTKLAAVVNGGYVYVSANSGANWTEQTSAGSRVWWRTASSSDGTKLAAAVTGGYIYTAGPATAPTVTTTAVSGITTITATSGGNVTDDGGATVSARGVCWSTSAHPTIADPNTANGTGAGGFTSGLTGLTAGTRYYVRAYATNVVGTAYGNELHFNTASSESITASGGSAGFVTGGPASVIDPNVAVAGGSIAGFKVAVDSNFATGDVLAYTGSLPGGVSAAYNATSGVLTFSGTASASNWQTLLRTVTFRTTSGSLAARTITFTLGTAIPCEETGHFYEFVPVTCTWSTAKTAAEGRTLYGLEGYLATITSQAENDFIRQKLAADAWIGGSDEAVEGTWRWVTGPESGTQFSSGSTPVGGQFTNWNTGEPNNLGGEDYTEIFSTDGVGKWNDLNGITTLTGYVAEYGGMPGDPPTQITANRDVTLTAGTAPTVTTAVVAGITAVSASSGGDVTSDGGVPVTARGVCWSTSANPTIADPNTSNGTGAGEFTSSITGLNSGTTYHVRAYATNNVGTAYGNDVSFITLPPAPVATAAADLTPTSFTAHWDTAASATGYRLDVSANSGFTGFVTGYQSLDVGAATSYVVNSNLAAGTTYYYRVRAYNGSGTGANSNTINLTTLTVPTVTTLPVTSIATTTAVGGGNVTADGGAAVAVRGVCWNRSGSPTTGDSKTTDGAGTGEFASNIMGLLPGMTYHVRAYATNSVGTAYGSEITFVALPTLPTITTVTPSGIGADTATSGGDVLADGGAAVTARGVCWNITGSPTPSDGKTIDGIGTGSFASSLTGLLPSTTYYVRAYAINSAGTGYSSEVNFTTADAPQDASVPSDDGGTPPPPLAPQLQVFIEADVQQVLVGETIDCSVRVRNVGDGGATNVEVTVSLPPDTEFVGAWWLSPGAAQAAPLAASVENGVIHLQVGDVDAGDDLRIDLELRASKAGTLEITAAAASPELAAPVDASAPASADVTDEYVQVVRMFVPWCGPLGLTPLLTLFGLVGLKLQGRRV